MVAEFLNGERHWQSLHGYTCEEVGVWLDYYRTHSGREFMDQHKMTYTDHASIQGYWHPYIHSDPSLATTKFPEPELSFARNQETTATETLIEMFNEQLKGEESADSPEEFKLESRKQGAPTMAALIKKAPALLNTAKELARPKLPM